MNKGKNEFLGLLCNLYLIALLAALPLYTGEGYWKLGDTKYVLFRSVSVLVLGCWIVLGMPGRIRAVREWQMEAVGKRAGNRTAKVGQGGKVGGYSAFLGTRFGPMDCAVAAYGLCVAISALCSDYGQLAWVGYNEWYMGAFSQLMFVGIYFFVSRQYDGAAYPLYLGEAAIALVTLFGLLHRLGIDPLGLQTGWNSGDWEYNHMLSTLGNVNWLCGFYSVALAFVLAHFFLEEKSWRQIGLYLSAVAALVLLAIQGSQGGLLIIAVGMCVCMLLGWGHTAIMRKWFLLLAGFFACMPVIDFLTKLRGKKAAVAADGNIFDHTVWYGWGIAAVVCLICFCLVGRADGLRRRHKEDSPKERGERRKGQKAADGRRAIIRKKILAAILISGVAALGLAGYLLQHGIDDSFGSGRGFLWRIALEGFGQAGVKDKLLGAGPDCYGEAVFLRLGAGTDVWNGEHWEGAVFTNAHNEVLSQLINVGILGTVCYLAIFLTGFCRYGGVLLEGQRSKDGRNVRQDKAGYIGWLGVLVIAMYGMHSLISFQQVLNAPLLFLTLGLCEYGIRRRRAEPE